MPACTARPSPRSSRRAPRSGAVTADGATEWALAARRGNMDLFFDLVDSPLGEPKYHDFYARAGRRLQRMARRLGRIRWSSTTGSSPLTATRRRRRSSRVSGPVLLAAVRHRRARRARRPRAGGAHGAGERAVGERGAAGRRQRLARRRTPVHDRFAAGRRLAAPRCTFVAASRRRLAVAERPLRLRGRSRVRSPVPDARRRDRARIVPGRSACGPRVTSPAPT